MSITNVRAAFEAALQGRASCPKATLDYLDGGRQQLLTFFVKGPNGDAEVKEAIECWADPTAEARRIAENYLKSIE